jgi:Uma2 family endonuclease
MDAALKHPTMLDEFLEWEERQPERLELVGGVVRLMAGGTADHDRIAVNIAAALQVRLRGSGCFVHGSNLKVLSRGENASTYPDVFVRCGPLAGRATRTDDPVVVFEVLSESTAEDDLTRKKLVYKAIWSLRAIVYVSQRDARLTVLRRDVEGRWSDDEPVEGLGRSLALPELGIALPMAEIYENTEVAASAAARATSAPS